ncbi:hypothetical protein [Bartonella sp. CL70QHWL]|uniref:hypothetical protein n=1 Tax=Bartonella sp. CL70QHWL TaxID=3243539 RepID=UPI0035CF48AB
MRGWELGGRALRGRALRGWELGGRALRGRALGGWEEPACFFIQRKDEKFYVRLPLHCLFMRFFKRNVF